MLVLFYAMRLKEKYLVQFMRLFLDASQKLPAFQGQSIQMVSTVQATLFAKNNVNWMSSYVRMGLIRKAAKMPICVYPGDEITTEIYVLRNVLQCVPTMNLFVLEHFKERDAEESHFVLKKHWIAMGWNAHSSAL